MARSDFGRRPVDPARLQEADALLSDPRAFDPPPSSLADEPGFRVLNAVCKWAAGIGFIVLLAVLVLMA